MFDLYLITPDTAPNLVLQRCERALSAAPRARVAVQLRSKQLDVHARRALAAELRALTRAHAAALLVNGDSALALDIGADGVQAPEQASVAELRVQLPAPLSIGASRHDLAGVLAAAAAGADFVTLSPIYEVADKNAPLGVDALRAIAAHSPVPLFALGGIDAARAREAIAAGAHGVAVIREVWDSADPAQAVARLIDAIDAGHGLKARAKARSIFRA